MPKVHPSLEEDSIVKTLERKGSLESVARFFIRTHPTHAFDDHQLPAAAFTFHDDGTVRCHALPETVMWLHADPLEALRFQAVRYQAPLIVAAVWSVAPGGEIVPALLCAGKFADEIAAVDKRARMSPVKNTQAFLARQRRRTAQFTTAWITAQWIDENLDLAKGRLIDRANKPVARRAMQFWTFAEICQLPFLPPLTPGVALEFPRAVPDENILRAFDVASGVRSG